MQYMEVGWLDGEPIARETYVRRGNHTPEAYIADMESIVRDMRARIVVVEKWIQDAKKDQMYGTLKFLRSIEDVGNTKTPVHDVGSSTTIRVVPVSV